MMLARGSVLKVNNINVLIILTTFLAVLLSTTAIPFGYFHLAWSVAVAYSTLAQCIIPLCLLICGYLVLNEPIPAARTVLARMLKLLIILLFWSVIYTGLRHLINQFDPQSEVNTLFILLVGQFKWVIPVFLLLLLLTPLLNTFVITASRQRTRYMMLVWFVLASVYLLFSNIRSELIHSNTVIESSTLELTVYLAGFYLAGGAIRRFHIQTNVRLSGIIFCLAWVATATMTYALSVNMVSPNRSFLFYSSPLLVVMAVSLFFMLLEYPFTVGGRISKLLDTLAQLSVSIFLTHLLVLPLMLWMMAIDFNNYSAAYTIPVVAMVCFVVSAGLCWLITSLPLLRRLR
ncbi:MAG: hypothetical protein XXXJIFNMEKO3_00452 [Candidatus Erwinia impunctatus]|nr:hypothetical protein XXXJIFNMEKO_00452 [Culicoides impunctatus]